MLSTHLKWINIGNPTRSSPINHALSLTSKCKLNSGTDTSRNNLISECKITHPRYGTGPGGGRRVQMSSGVPGIGQITCREWAIDAQGDEVDVILAEPWKITIRRFLAGATCENVFESLTETTWEAIKCFPDLILPIVAAMFMTSKPDVHESSYNVLNNAWAW